MTAHDASPSALAPDAPPSPAPIRRIGLYLLFATLAWNISSAAAPLLLQSLLAQSDPARKVQLTAVATTTAAVVAVAAALLAGALSDRTRTRFGARKPWILGTAVFGAACGALMLLAHDFVLMCISFVGLQVGIAAMVVVLSALLPDHVPSDRLGRTSSLMGLGSLLGIASGGAIGSAFLEQARLGIAVVPLLMVLLAVVGWFVLPSSPTTDAARQPASPKSFLASLRPPADRDFYLVFAGRVLFLLALVTVSGFQLFILTDHYHASPEVTARTIALGGVLLALGAGISTVVFGQLSDRVRRRKPFIAGAGAVLVLALAALLVIQSPNGFLVYCAIAAVAFGAYIAVDQALMVEVLPAAGEPGKDLGILTVANTVPSVLAPGLAATLVGAGGYPLVFVGAIVIAVASTALIIPIRRVR